MLAEHIALGFLGLFAGIAVSAGTFAFILVIGVIPRMLRKGNLAKYVITVENVVFPGVLAGALLSLFSSTADTPFPAAGHLILALYGISAGVFVGCIAVALAEILDTFPIVFRRAKIKRGLSWVMVAMALGKMTGALYFFICGYAAGG